uniref:Uncharacterized protein n=1 Tax=Oryza sativa subsp. japonica TaxID=39947 RepID=Q75I43_ORYSJ|nr:hypothetical protein [Oryza sativa Japonica Group]
MPDTAPPAVAVISGEEEWEPAERIGEGASGEGEEGETERMEARISPPLGAMHVGEWREGRRPRTGRGLEGGVGMDNRWEGALTGGVSADDGRTCGQADSGRRPACMSAVVGVLATTGNGAAAIAAAARCNGSSNARGCSTSTRQQQLTTGLQREQQLQQLPTIAAASQQGGRAAARAATMAGARRQQQQGGASLSYFL